MFTITDLARLLNRPYMQVYRMVYRYHTIPAPTLMPVNKRRPLYSQAQVDAIVNLLANQTK